jgi:hypothetical protein
VAEEMRKAGVEAHLAEPADTAATLKPTRVGIDIVPPSSLRHNALSG